MTLPAIQPFGATKHLQTPVLAWFSGSVLSQVDLMLSQVSFPSKL
jgi:hypothetical protein